MQQRYRSRFDGKITTGYNCPMCNSLFMACCKMYEIKSIGYTRVAVFSPDIETGIDLVGHLPFSVKGGLYLKEVHKEIIPLVLPLSNPPMQWEVKDSGQQSASVRAYSAASGPESVDVAHLAKIGAVSLDYTLILKFSFGLRCTLALFISSDVFYSRC